MIKLLILHFIADAAWQPDWMLKAKTTNWYVMMEHSMVWAGLLYLFFPVTIGKFLFLLIGHFLIDTWKAKSAPDILDKKYLYLDQLLHLAQLLVVYRL